ncbi:hypothetical protein BXT86_00340 [candidate division WOR-3 bacterium 4484_100]|uniref:VTT domain-containing protein n=1 Tax=candidate division WOR-3 bacterium 4484_100 TaxID=1936077 RepID=A0A1V4QH17_UNCW3|nr:MAG: hypothetical protein BXT86_00340 [candidate division WOR-3 bacterium 4484_100]
MVEWLAARPLVLVYAFLLFNAFFESIFPPYPSDAFVLVISFIAGQGIYSIFMVYFCTVIGSIAGVMTIYYLGRTKGDVLINYLERSFLGKFIPVKLFERAKTRFHHRGAIAIFLNRFIPGMRAPICFVAGMVKINGRTFFLFSSASILLWNLFLVLVGFYVGNNWESARRFLRAYNIIIGSLIAALILIFLVVYLVRMKRKKL